MWERQAVEAHALNASMIWSRLRPAVGTPTSPASCCSSASFKKHFRWHAFSSKSRAKSPLGCHIFRRGMLGAADGTSTV